MRKIIFKIFLLSVIVILFDSCKKDVCYQKDMPGEAAIFYYKQLLEGRIEDWIDAKISCDSISRDYKIMMTTMFRQTVADSNEKYGKIIHIQLDKVEEAYNGGVEVFLKIRFERGERERISIPLLWNGEKWRIQ